MTKNEFPSILRFYLACVEAEDRHSLTIPLSALHHSLVSPWDTQEAFFCPQNAEVEFEAKCASDRDLLLGSVELAGSVQRFLYGYPVFWGEKSFLSPLFVAEVDVEQREGDRFAMRHADAGHVRLNHHLFQMQHAVPEDLRAIQEELEGEYGTFVERLRAAFEALGLPTPDFSPNRLEPYPTNDSPANRWLNRPILFKSERSPYTHLLRRELDALVRYPRLLDALGKTSVGALVGIAPPAPRETNQSAPTPLSLLQVLPLNRGQEDAARAALEAPLTVVTGPPGTGKSQIVVDLLASCARAGRPVLFASKNNKAVDVVCERLSRILGEEQDWTLRLGSRNVMEVARARMNDRLGTLRTEAVPPSPAPKLLYDIDQQIAATRHRIERLERAQVEYAELERDLRAAERLVEPDWVKSWTECPASAPDIARVEHLTATMEALAGTRPAPFWLRVKRTFAEAALRRQLRVELRSLAEMLPEQVRRDIDVVCGAESARGFGRIAEACAMLNRLALWRFADDECERALTKIGGEEAAVVLSQELDRLQGRRAELARDQLRATWTARLASRIALVRHTLGEYFERSASLRQSRGSAYFHRLESLKTAIQSLSADLPVWVVTNLSVNNALPLEPAIFDLVIIDEASQSDIPSALPLLFRARRALIIGDPRQLSHISAITQREEETLADQHGVAHLLASWSYNKKSFYALAAGSIVERGETPLLLVEHYRSHPEIIEFSNRTFYGGQLILRTALGDLRKRLPGESLGIFWHDVRGCVSRSSHSAVNAIEVGAVVDLLDKWARTGLLMRDDVDFGVVTPFALQAERIQEAVRTCPWWEQLQRKERLRIGTVHKFQGDERDVMIFSPVVADDMSTRLSQWVATTDQLLNVAVTRARGALHIVGDLQACREAGHSLKAFATAATSGDNPLHPRLIFGSPAETRMAELLTEAGLWYAPQHDVGRYKLDFLVVTPFGTRYDIEVDGRGHRASEAVRSDEVRDAAVKAMGLKVLRVEARRLFNQEAAIRALLLRLV